MIGEDQKRRGGRLDGILEVVGVLVRDAVESPGRNLHRESELIRSIEGRTKRGEFVEQTAHSPK